MKSFIEFNTDMRAKSETDFEKDLFKLCNNSIFGKTMESVRHHRDCKFVVINDDKDREKAVKKYSSVFCTGFKMINENTICYLYKKKELVLKKPIYVGSAILDLSKRHMYDFHYNHIKKWFPGDRSKLLFTDTDSLVYLIKSKDINKELEDKGEYFDNSGYHEGHPLRSTKNKKVPGKFKDEMEGLEIDEFVGLRSKVYSIKVADTEKKRLKGIKKSVVKNEISHEDYYNMLFVTDQKPMYHSFRSIQAKDHEVCTTFIKKISLTNTDDKRFLLDNIESLPYGHYRIPEEVRNRTVKEILSVILDKLAEELGL